MITSVEHVDVINGHRALGSDTVSFRTSYELIFLNLCPANNLLQRGDENRVLLIGILTAMARIFTDNGSLVVALEDMRPDNDYLKCA